MLKKLPDHPIAQAFPMADPDDRKRIKESLEKNGQLEEIVTLDGMVLDGRNRQEILIDELKIEPLYTDWKDLPESLTKNGPVEYVKARNFDRRHLNPSQKAAVAVNLKPFYEAEAAERQKATLKQNQPSAPNGANGDGMSQDDGRDPAEESQAPPRKSKKDGGKAAAKAAAATGASTRSVERADALKKKNPKAFAKVLAGKSTLSKETKNVAKEQQAKTEVEDALKRIANVAGKDTAEKMKGRKRAEILELAGLSDDDMIKVRGLINHGWSVSKSRHYKMTALSRTHTIGDLLTRALAIGVGKTGQQYSLEIKFEEVPLEITVARKD